MAKWDVFISHASEDKAEVVEPLVKLLLAEGLKVWYDKHALKLGDSLSRKIDEGLSKSSFGVVVLSPRFFDKNWPQRELDGLTSRESVGHKVILPIWHQVDREAVVRFSPMLAAKLAVSTSQGLDEIVRQILDVVRAGDCVLPPSHPFSVEIDSGGIGKRSPRSRRGWLLGLALFPMVLGVLVFVVSHVLERQTSSGGLEALAPTSEEERKLKSTWEWFLITISASEPRLREKGLERSFSHIWAQFFSDGLMLYDNARAQCWALSYRDQRCQLFPTVEYLVTGGLGNTEILDSRLSELLEPLTQDERRIAEEAIRGDGKTGDEASYVRGGIATIYIKNKLWERLGSPIGTEWSPNLLVARWTQNVVFCGLPRSPGDRETRVVMVLDTDRDTWVKHVQMP
jgi:hypothetical protein